ncbi:methyltransferase [Methylocystis rosea]|uniref:Class I SAM-dependent methyltransferase n=1 Tax=Methylocystis rosea TaxID=173366 RepID=A0A3G8M0N0_9HYPH|nr:class I SAM-dependent methyltransferase [Methylocystis rosea]AZG75533.1 class I SAM-dependent methyltransferase [Methylocystis rosea]
MQLDLCSDETATAPSTATHQGLSVADEALLRLGAFLRDQNYRFTTTTPLTHNRVVQRSAVDGSHLTRAFGWSLPFYASDLPVPVLRILAEAKALAHCNGLLRSKVRFSTLKNQLFAHSAFPTDAADSVFFGPDTYRFARCVESVLNSQPISGSAPGRFLDIGCGSGAGGIFAASLMRPGVELLLADINPQAVRYARVNAALNGLKRTQAIHSDLFQKAGGPFDYIIANPPYLVDDYQRLYRHGGGEFGIALSVDIVREGIPRLTESGRLLLYTGSPIVGGVDQFLAAVTPILDASPVTFDYDEVDPDVFGEELERSAYDHVDRIAAVFLNIKKDG